MIGIVVPAHNEEAQIENCVQSAFRAATHAGLRGEAVEVIVVLDACQDRTGALARSLGARTINVQAGNVGLARQIGAQMAVASGARWLAFTDADSVVAPDWLVAQLAQDADAVCGTIAVDDWAHYGERMRQHFDLTYNDRDGHSHIHGANLGVSTSAYATAGGFPGLATGEDVALVQALGQTGARIAWSSAPRVVTSVRRDFRAPAGFGATLEKIDRLRQWVGIDLAAAG